MASRLQHLNRRAGLAGAVFFLGTTVWAQAPNQQSPPSDGKELRRPIPSSVQEDLQTSSDKSRAESDKKLREMDRRLDRTLRSVCSGC